MNDLSVHFQHNWQKHFSNFCNGRVLLAVSGGKDSMTLASLFKAADVPFAIAHCNFGLRGEEADEDEALVTRWAGDNGIPFHTIKFDTRQKCEEWKNGTQETARILRYDWFENLRISHGYIAIATAHHADDNVETVMMKLLKGTGLQGIRGILPVNGHIIRPLLFASRKDIEIYVADNNVPFREDASNASDDYLRNAIRHRLLPVAEQLVPGAISNINNSIARFGEANQLYERVIATERKKLIEQRGNDHYIPVRKLRLRSPLITICYELAKPFGFTAAQTEQILKLLDTETGHFVSSGSHRIIRHRDFLVITALAAGDTDLIRIETLPTSVQTGSFLFRIETSEKTLPINEDPRVAIIDAKEITLPLVLRKWRTGDYFYPLGMGMKKKKVARMLIDKKLALHEKEQVYVLESNKKIIWVAGLRLDERFKVRPSTSSVIRIQMLPA